jgi:hypothetical protein
MIYRTFFCLNRNCMEEFTVTDQENPPCPICGGAKVQWIPKTTGVMSEKTQSVDNTVKQLQADYGNKNYRSPVRGESTAPRPAPQVPGRTMRFAPKSNPGWALNIPVDQNGHVIDRASCGPTGVTVKGKHPVGDGRSKVPLNDRVGSGPTPRLEASHRPPGGVR